jgi:hypothetical protein
MREGDRRGQGGQGGVGCRGEVRGRKEQGEGKILLEKREGDYKRLGRR